MKYCIIVKRECEEDYVFHKDFDFVPERKDILEIVMGMDLNYNDDYGKLEYWEVK